MLANIQCVCARAFLMVFLLVLSKALLLKRKLKITTTFIFFFSRRERERERERENLDVEHLDSLWEKKLEYEFWRSKCNSTHQDQNFPHSQFIPIKSQKLNLIFHTILYQLPCKDNGYKNLSSSTNFACPIYLASQSLGRQKWFFFTFYFA